MSVLRPKLLGRYFVSFLFIALAMSLLFFSFYSFDGDVLWHIKMGEDIVNTQSVSTVNLYTWLSGSQWNQQEWLFDVLLYGVVYFFDIWGFYLLHGLFFCFLFWYCFKRVQPKYPYLFVLFFALALYFFPHCGITRPIFYSTLFFLLAVQIYDTYDSFSFLPFFLFFLIGTVMSNFHCGNCLILLAFLIGYVFLDIFMFVVSDDIPKHDIKYILYRFGLIVSFVLGIGVNPLGYYPFGQMIKAVGMDNTFVLEWKPFSSGSPFNWLFILLSFGLVFCNLRLSDGKALKHSCTLFVFFVLSLLSRKAFIIYVYFYLVYGYLFFENFCVDIYKRLIRFGEMHVFKLIGSKKFICVSVFLSLVCCCTVYAGQSDFSFDTLIQKYCDGCGISGEIIECLKIYKPERLYNGYGVGNSLMWNDIPVFLDTRQHPYTENMGSVSSFEDSIDLIKDVHRNTIDGYFEKYDFDAVLVDEGCGVLLYYMQLRSDFENVVSNDLVSLWIKKDT